jgi:hypothetical protein
VCFVISLIPATVWVMVGYFVLFTSTRADGAVRTLGRGLAIWLFIIAACIPLVGAYVTIAGLCPIDQIIQKMSVQ